MNRNEILEKFGEIKELTQKQYSNKKIKICDLCIYDKEPNFDIIYLACKTCRNFLKTREYFISKPKNI